MGDLMQVKEMIASGASVNDGDYDGRTPLHLGKETEMKCRKN